MLNIKNESKLKITRLFLWINGIFLLFWWPLSHWFYPDFYHQLLGFSIGSYPDNMVKIIGACGFCVVLLIFFSALNPVRNRDCIIILIVFAILISLTYIFVIIFEGFPVLEFINVGFSIFSAVFLILFYPWKYKQE